MPIYIYRCESCGVQFERHQSFTDEPLKRCPECSKNSLRKVLTPAGIVFKGSGWYATDHKSSSSASRPLKSENRENRENSASKSESAASSSSSEGSGKSESSSKSESSGKTESSSSSGSSESSSSSSAKSESSNQSKSNE